MQAYSSEKISVPCSIMISNNNSSPVAMVRDRSKYGLLSLTKNGLVQLEFVSKMVLSYNVSDLNSIFDRFIGEGKATLRFKKASQDVMLQTKDISALKQLVRALKKVRSGGNTSELAIPIIGASSKSEKTNQENLNLKNENGKRPAVSEIQPDKDSAIPLKRKTLSGSPAVKKSESHVSKVFRSFREISKFVTALSFQKCRFVSFTNADQLKSLTSLELNHCILQHFPSELASLPNILNINLSNNKISKICPESLSSFPKLVNLDLSSNLLDHIPLSMINLTALKHLNLRNNLVEELTTLPSSVVNVNLAENPLKVIWTNKYTKFFGEMDISALSKTKDNNFSQLSSIRDPLNLTSQIPSLFELSARVTAAKFLKIYWLVIPPVITEQLERECFCSICCKLVLQAGCIQRRSLVHMGWRSETTDISSQSVNFLSIVCQFCNHNTKK